MRRLIDGLLALGRASVENVEREQQDLAAIVRERVENWRGLADESQVELIVTTPTHARVWAVPTAIEQITDNYIDNALSVMPTGGQLVIDVRADAESATLTVTDSGPGISQSDADRAFDRFWRGSATHEGTGLGLAVVKQLAQSSGAGVALRPAPDGGTAASARFEISP